MIAVYRFFIDYGPAKERIEVTDPVTGETRMANRRIPGKTAEIHKVEYGPLGSERTRVIAPVSSLIPKMEHGQKPQPGSAGEMALAKWEFIQPLYERWLDGQSITPDGTPLAAWAGVGPEQAEALKRREIHTVEQLAQLTDSHIERYGIQNMRGLVDNAKRFISTLDKATVENALAEKDAEIVGLRDSLQTMQTMMREMSHTVANLKMAQQERVSGGGHTEQTENDPGNDDAFGGEEVVRSTKPRRTARA